MWSAMMCWARMEKRRGARFAYNRGKSVNHLLEHKFSLQAPSANAGWADGVMDVCWGRSGPPVAAWPGRHGDPWSLCFCSRSFGRRTLPEEDCLFWKFTSQRWMALPARTMSRAHAFRGFVSTRESEKMPCKDNRSSTLLPFVVHH